MAIVINGSGTVTGLAVGGLPDGTVDSGTIATGTIVDADVANLAASKLTGALPAISGASLTGITTGKILQVVQSVSNTATYPSNSWTDVTGSSISITPSVSSSKILYIFNTGGLCGGDTRGLKMKILRGSTQIRRVNRYGYSTVTLGAVPIFFTYLDSPNTTSAVTYKIQAAEENTSGAWEINDAAETAGAVVIAMEIAG